MQAGLLWLSEALAIVVVLCHQLQCFLKDLPKLDRLVVCAEQEMSGVLPPAPLDLVDLFFDLERLEIVKLGFVRLELGVKLVLAALFLFQAVSASAGRV